MIRPIKDRDGKEKNERRHDDSEQISNLHLRRRSAEDVSDFQILKHLARDRRRDADHGCYSEDGRNSAGA